MWDLRGMHFCSQIAWLSICLVLLGFRRATLQASILLYVRMRKVIYNELGVGLKIQTKTSQIIVAQSHMSLFFSCMKSLVVDRHGLEWQLHDFTRDPGVLYLFPLLSLVCGFIHKLQGGSWCSIHLIQIPGSRRNMKGQRGTCIQSFPLLF